MPIRYFDDPNTLVSSCESQNPGPANRRRRGCERAVVALSFVTLAGMLAGCVSAESDKTSTSTTATTKKTETSTTSKKAEKSEKFEKPELETKTPKPEVPSVPAVEQAPAKEVLPNGEGNHIKKQPVVETPPPAPPVQNPAPAPQLAPAPVPAPAPQPAAANTSYSSCREAKEAGAAPLYRGNPGYSSQLDRDGDGVACEK